jgi:hypothetical protein
MVPNRLNVRWLRPALATLALAALALLGGCGGGSGAPNNPFAPKPVPPGPVLIIPAALTAYSNTPTTLTVTGGVPPYFVVSSDTQVLPLGGSVSTGTIALLPGDVTAPTAVTVSANLRYAGRNACIGSVRREHDLLRPDGDGERDRHPPNRRPRSGSSGQV